MKEKHAFLLSLIWCVFGGISIGLFSSETIGMNLGFVLSIVWAILVSVTFALNVEE